MVQYRPVLIAKRGELSALKALSAGTWSGLKPVLQVPPREWDFELGSYKKTLEEHLRELPKKFHTATKGNAAFLDLSLLDAVTPVFGGRHPLAWFVDEAATHGLELTPLVLPTSHPATVAAAADINARLGRGVGIRLAPAEWTSIAPRVLPRLMTDCGVAHGDVDLFVDVGREFSVLVDQALLAELSNQDGSDVFRSRSIGGAAFPDTAGLAKGLSAFARSDWQLFRDAYRARLRDGAETPDFFDNAIQNPDIEIGTVNPRFLSISGLFRYTVDEDWLVAKGDLFKGQAGLGVGGAALITPVTLLRAHPQYANPIRTETEDWIDAVIAGTQSPGNPEAWRRWATQRHLSVVVHQLSIPI
ncbi:MAG: hypothetical protein KF801_03885 [Cryobacterium sp.]|nr:hypothetical protein [Cryobacterium sp.]